LRPPIEEAIVGIPQDTDSIADMDVASCKPFTVTEGTKEKSQDL